MNVVTTTARTISSPTRGPRGATGPGVDLRARCDDARGALGRLRRVLAMHGEARPGSGADPRAVRFGAPIEPRSPGLPLKFRGPFADPRHSSNCRLTARRDPAIIRRARAGRGTIA